MGGSFEEFWDGASHRTGVIATRAGNSNRIARDRIKRRDKVMAAC
jgi:hypothetical protein